MAGPYGFDRAGRSRPGADPSLHPPAPAAEHHAVPTVRLVACDLDGTLLGPGAVLTDRTRAVLAAADAADSAVSPPPAPRPPPASNRRAGAPTVPSLVGEKGAVLYDRHEAAV